MDNVAQPMAAFSATQIAQFTLVHAAHRMAGAAIPLLIAVLAAHLAVALVLPHLLQHLRALSPIRKTDNVALLMATFFATQIAQSILVHAALRLVGAAIPLLIAVLAAHLAAPAPTPLPQLVQLPPPLLPGLMEDVVRTLVAQRVTLLRLAAAVPNTDIVVLLTVIVSLQMDARMAAQALPQLPLQLTQCHLNLHLQRLPANPSLVSRRARQHNLQALSPPMEVAVLSLETLSAVIGLKDPAAQCTDIVEAILPTAEMVAKMVLAPSQMCLPQLPVLLPQRPSQDLLRWQVYPACLLCMLA